MLATGLSFPKTPSFGFRISGTGSWNLCKWNLDSGFIELHSGFRKSRIPDSRSEYSTLDEQNIPPVDSGIQITFDGAKSREELVLTL